MPGDALNGARRMALVGKLPAHGDFVRRGEAGLVQRLDTWLTGEVERRAVADGDALDVRLAALPAWCFTLPEGMSGAIVASSDRIGRVFPLVGCVAGCTRAAAEQVADALIAARDGVRSADQVGVSLSMWETGDGEPVSHPDDAADAARWWQPFAAAPKSFAPAGLPTGPDFLRLLEVDG